MKILYLPLKKEWYEMIERGEKTEDYREIKQYYISRFFENELGRNPIMQVSLRDLFEMSLRCTGDIEKEADDFGLRLKHFDAVCFSYGYTRRWMMFECKGITIGRGRHEWGAPDYETFIIKLGAEMI